MYNNIDKRCILIFPKFKNIDLIQKIRNKDVVFNYIVTPENLELIKAKINDYNIKFVVVLVDEATLLLRDKSRPEDCQMKERCITLLNNFKNRNYNPQNILDTTNLSVEEIINIIQNDNKFILWEVSVWIV